jgi:hypothetical protein
VLMSYRSGGGDWRRCSGLWWHKVLVVVGNLGGGGGGGAWWLSVGVVRSV